MYIVLRNSGNNSTNTHIRAHTTASRSRMLRMLFCVRFLALLLRSTCKQEHSSLYNRCIVGGRCVHIMYLYVCIDRACKIRSIEILFLLFFTDSQKRLLQPHSSRPHRARRTAQKKKKKGAHVAPLSSSLVGGGNREVRPPCERHATSSSVYPGSTPYAGTTHNAHAQNSISIAFLLISSLLFSLLFSTV